MFYTKNNVKMEKNQYMILTNLKKMLEEEEPKLQGFFDELISSTNPQMKNSITNQQNKKKLVAFCHFLAGLNNKFINGVKTEVGFLLSASGASASTIETL